MGEKAVLEVPFIRPWAAAWPTLSAYQLLAFTSV